MEETLKHILQWLALPEHGLSTVFVVSFISATLLPLGSEPAVFGLVKLNPDLFWPAVLVATVGNTLGGALDWAMGYGANWITDWYAYDAEACARLGLSGEEKVSGFILIGEPGDPPRERERPEFEGLVRRWTP
jgi:membrane protein YqaA with SNARE-associated domain